MQSVDEEQAKQDEERVKLLRDLDRDLDRELNVSYTDEEVAPLIDIGPHDGVDVAPFGTRVAPGRPVTMETRPRTLETKDISHKTELPPEEKVVKTPDTPIETLDFPPPQTDLHVMVSRSDETVIRSPTVASTTAASDTFVQQEQGVVLVGEDTRMFAAGSAQLETSPELRTSIPEPSGIQEFKPETLPASDILKSQETSVIGDTDISKSHPDAIVSPPSTELFFPEDSTTLQPPVTEDKALIQQTDVTIQGDDVRLGEDVTKPQIGHEIAPADLEIKAEGVVIMESAPYPSVDTVISQRLEERDSKFQPIIGQQPPVGLEGQMITQQQGQPDELQVDVPGELKVVDSKDIFMPLETEKIQVAPIPKIEDKLEEQLPSIQKMEISEIRADTAKMDEKARTSETVDEPKVAVPQEELITDVPEFLEILDEALKVTVPEEELIVEVPKALADIERGIQPEAPVGALSQEGLQLAMLGISDTKEPETPTTQVQTPVSKEELELETPEVVPKVLQVKAPAEATLQVMQLEAPEVPELAVCERLQIETPEPVPVTEGAKLETPIAAPEEELKLETPTMPQERIQEEAPATMTLPGEEIKTEVPIATVEGERLEASELPELEAEAPSLDIPKGLMQEAPEAPELVTIVERVRFESQPESEAPSQAMHEEGMKHDAPESVAVAEGVHMEAPDAPEVAIGEGITPEAPEPVEDLELKAPEGEELKLEVPEDRKMVPSEVGLKPEDLEALKKADSQKGISLQLPSADISQETSTTEVPKEESQIETPEVVGSAVETEAAYIETAKEIVDSAVEKAKEKFAEEQVAVEPVISRGSAEEVERKPEPETQELQPEFTDLPTPGSAEMEMLNVQLLSGVDVVHDDDALISEILGEDTAAATAERPDDLVGRPEIAPITKEEGALTEEVPTEVEISSTEQFPMEQVTTVETPKTEAEIAKLYEQKADDTECQPLKETAVNIAEETIPKETEVFADEDKAHRVLESEEETQVFKIQEDETPEIPSPEREQTTKADSDKQLEKIGETEMAKQAAQIAQEPDFPTKVTEEARLDNLSKQKPKPAELPEQEWPEQGTRPEELPQQEPRPEELPEQEPAPEKLLEHEIRPEELPEQEPRPEEVLEQESRPHELPEQEPGPEEFPEQETRPDELPEQDIRPKELPEQERRPEELPQQEPVPEEVPEQETRPEELPEQETRPEELPEQEPRPEELPEQEPRLEKLPEEETRPQELPEQGTKPDELPDQEPVIEKLPEQEISPEELPEQEPRLEVLPEQKPVPEELPEQETRLEELVEQKIRSEELPEKEHRPEELPEQETKPEELPEQETRLEKLPEQEPRPEEALEQDTKLEEQPEQEPAPEKLLEQEIRPGELPDQETKPEEILEQETKSEELPEQEPAPEKLLEKETRLEELPAQETRPQELPEQEIRPEELPEQEPRPEELPEEETKPAELPEQEPRLEELREQDTKPEEVPEQETKPEELPEQETKPEELPEQEIKPEELPVQETKPDELPEQEPRPEELPEEEEAYHQAASQIVSSAIIGAKKQFIKEQAETKEGKPEEEMTHDVEPDFPGNKPDDLIHKGTAEIPESTEIDIHSAIPEKLEDEKVTETKLQSGAEVTLEDEMPNVERQELATLQEDEAKVTEPLEDLKTEEKTPSDAVIEESEPEAACEAITKTTQSEVPEAPEEKAEKVPEDKSSKKPTDKDRSTELTEVVDSEQKDERTEEVKLEPSFEQPVVEPAETVPEKVEEPLEEVTMEDIHEKRETTTVEDVKPDQREPAAEDVSGAETELKPEEPVTVELQSELQEPETETKPEEAKILETETKPKEAQIQETETKPEEAKGK